MDFKELKEKIKETNDPVGFLATIDISQFNTDKLVSLLNDNLSEEQIIQLFSIDIFKNSPEEFKIVLFDYARMRFSDLQRKLLLCENYIQGISDETKIEFIRKYCVITSIIDNFDKETALRSISDEAKCKALKNCNHYFKELLIKSFNSDKLKLQYITLYMDEFGASSSRQASSITRRFR